MTVEEIYRKRHDEFLAPLAPPLEANIRNACEGIDRIDRISVRAKGVASFLKKAQKREGDAPKYEDPINEIQDQIGARIVVFYRCDVDIVTKRIRDFYRPIEHDLKEPEREDAFGYFGMHFILFLPPEIVPPEIEPQVPKVFELQIKTLFQHAWSEGNHDLAYKPNKRLTLKQKRLIAFAAGQAWGADEVFQQLFDDLNSSADADSGRH